MSLPFLLEFGRTLILSNLKCYRPQALSYARNPRLSPLPGRHRFTARDIFNMQTGMQSCKRMGKMMGRHLLRRVLVVERAVLHAAGKIEPPMGRTKAKERSS